MMLVCDGGDGFEIRQVGVRRIYLDYASSSTDDDALLTITFRDENGDLFDVVTWYYNAASDGTSWMKRACSTPATRTASWILTA